MVTLDKASDSSAPNPEEIQPPWPADDVPQEVYDAYWLKWVYKADKDAQFTFRALLVGCVVGGIMSFSNLYVGLKTGWGLGASITAAIVAFGLFKALQPIMGPRSPEFTTLENNTMQTAASSAAYMTSAGLVSAIPALYMTTGQTLTFWQLIPWLIGISLVGTVAAIPVKKKLINQERLRFPSGIACAETLRSLHGKGPEGTIQATALGVGSAIGGLIALMRDGVHLFAETLPMFGSLLMKRTVAFEPSLVMIGAGALMGLRVTISMFVVGLITWAVVPDYLFDQGWITCSRLAEGEVCTREMIGYRDINAWTLWPGVGLMVSHSLVGLAMQLPQMARGFAKTMSGSAAPRNERLDSIEIPISWFWIGIALTGTLSVFFQFQYFAIPIPYGILSVVLAVMLSFVAARSTGETDITPVGAMGKVTQLVFGGVLKGQITPNLMAASVTGGAASQVGDLLTDLKTGHLLGSKPRYQFFAQVAGVFVGSVFAAYAYTLLVNPEDLGGEKWPAPAAQTWAKVAELLANGLDSIQPSVLMAIYISMSIGAAFAVFERFAPSKWKKYMPSPSGMGIAMMIPFFNSFSMLVGALIAEGFAKVKPKLAERFTIVVSSGFIAGETLMAVVIIAWNVFFPAA
jgi:putative OPT family oligopeptide transporter